MAVLYVASDRARAGKTALSAALARRLLMEGRRVALFKPLRLAAAQQQPDSSTGLGQDADVEAFRHVLGRDGSSAPPVSVTPGLLASGLPGEVRQQVADAFSSLSRAAEVVVVEGLSGLAPQDGVAQASAQLADALDAQVVAVAGHTTGMDSSTLMGAAQTFGQRLLGVVINGVPRYQGRNAQDQVTPALERAGIRVLGAIPEDRILLGTTVGDIARELGGTFLCWEEHSDCPVEHFMLGGSLMDWGVLYFERKANKAVIVRGNRPDLAMAALRTDTACIVLTGGQRPIQYVEHEAREEEVPLILVEQDTHAVAEALGSLMERARFDHPRKLERFLELLAAHVDVGAIYSSLGPSR